ncbi:MAG: ATP-dependent DNA helicase [Bdellovibrionia bacterium]
MKKIQVAVRDFALPVPRTGSIELHSGYGPVPVTGQEMHSLTQALRVQSTPSYRPEVWISENFEHDGFQFAVSGRIDGIFDGVPSRIEEIKTAFSIDDLKRKLSDPTHPYVLQLKTYGYLYYKQNGVVPELSFHLVSIRNRKKTDDFHITLDVEDYEVWLKLRLEELAEEARANEASAKRRKKIAKSLEFPFQEPRPHQIELLETVAKSLEGEEPLLVQAPTGLGKTAAVIYPMLQEALSRGEKLVYVTPKNSQHTAAEETIKLFQDQGQPVRSLTIRAKAKLCFKAEPICNPEYCEYAKDHYKKIGENQVVQTMSKKKKVTYRSLRKIAKAHEVCPFELQMDLVDKTDVVICDYNYVFSPRSSLQRLSPEGRGKTRRPNLVIDEAHNLHSRGTSYFSPALSSFVLELLRPALDRLPSRFANEGIQHLNRCLSLIEAHRPVGCTDSAVIELDSSAILEQEAKLNDFLMSYLESDFEIQTQVPILKLANTWSNFGEYCMLTGDNFFATYTAYPRGGTIKITCCDASAMLKEVYPSFSHVTGFSATLKPFDYYGKLSGFDLQKLRTSEFKSPFPRSNRKLLVIPQISTKYSARAANYSKIAQTIERVTKIRPGNYFAFFPSFEFLERVADLLHLPEFLILRQRREMKNAQVEEYLEEMKARRKPVLLFGVQGGVFSEGVDYPGDMAIGAMIVGPGLPTFDLERERIRQFYEKHYGDGFAYAYVYPAMSKVIQSAGRVIRSETDRGLIVLMDDRFLSRPYYETMPADWFEESARELVSSEILKDVTAFWNGEERPARSQAVNAEPHFESRGEESQEADY